MSDTPSLVPEDQNAAKRKIARLVFAVSGKTVPIEDISLEIKPYAGRRTYLEVSITDEHIFSKNDRDLIAKSFSSEEVKTVAYSEADADKPLTLIMRGEEKSGEDIEYA